MKTKHFFIFSVFLSLVLFFKWRYDKKKLKFDRKKYRKVVFEDLVYIPDEDYKNVLSSLQSSKTYKEFKEKYPNSVVKEVSYEKIKNQNLDEQGQILFDYNFFVGLSDLRYHLFDLDNETFSKLSTKDLIYIFCKCSFIHKNKEYLGNKKYSVNIGYEESLVVYEVLKKGLSIAGFEPVAPVKDTLDFLTRKELVSLYNFMRTWDGSKNEMSEKLYFHYDVPSILELEKIRK